MKWHVNILPASQRAVLTEIGPLLTRHGFYLAGGTALALRLGHRRSLDLDWFRHERIAQPLLLAQDFLAATGRVAEIRTSPDTLYCKIRTVKVSLMTFGYPTLSPHERMQSGRCLVASLPDLAAMKLNALAQRGAKKDFVDLYALGLRKFTLPEILECYRKKFGVRDLGHVLYCLAYFGDADAERMPGMNWKVDWREIKQTIRGWLRELAQ